MLSDHEGVQSSFTKAHGLTNFCCELLHLVKGLLLGDRRENREEGKLGKLHKG